MTDDIIIELAVFQNLGRTLKPIGLDTGDVFYTDASYRTAELLDFARAIEALVRAECVPQWISVEDRLPEKHTEVLVAFRGLFLPSTGQYTGHPRDFEGWCYPSENNDLMDEDKDPVVTHWMPLPITPHEAAAPGITAPQAKDPT